MSVNDVALRPPHRWMMAEYRLLDLDASIDLAELFANRWVSF